LVVLRRAHPKKHLGLLGLEGKEVAAIELGAIRRDGINFPDAVLAAHQTFAIPTARIPANDNDVTLSRRPLALNPPQAVSDLKDQVVATALAHWSVDVDAKSNRSRSYREFCNVPFLI
jgi:hypothetical protein